MKVAARARFILHVDLDAFFVSVERCLDPSLRSRPVIVGGSAGSRGAVAAASAEAREHGVRAGQPLDLARRACPEAIFLPGDLEAYAAVSQEVSAILLAASRRVERPSIDEAYVDLTADGRASPQPIGQAERIKDELQRRLGLDASLGVAGSRLAARVASRWARPRGLLVVLPGYESSFLASEPVGILPDLPPHLERGLQAAGIRTLGELAAADPEVLASSVGHTAAVRLKAAATGEGEEPVAVTAPPSWVQEETRLRARGSDRPALESLLEGLARRAWRRLRPFGLVAGTMAIEVRRGASSGRRAETFQPGLADEETAAAVARSLAEPLFDPPGTVRSLHLRLSRLARPGSQSPLFPDISGVAR